jgi:hypothetical protein
VLKEQKNPLSNKSKKLSNSQVSTFILGLYELDHFPSHPAKLEVSICLCLGRQIQTNTLFYCFILQPLSSISNGTHTEIDRERERERERMRERERENERESENERERDKGRERKRERKREREKEREG